MLMFSVLPKRRLKPGFYMNEMFRQMEGHVLEEVVIKGEYKN